MIVSAYINDIKVFEKTATSFLLTTEVLREF